MKKNSKNTGQDVRKEDDIEIQPARDSFADQLKSGIPVDNYKEVPIYKSNWAQHMSQLSLEKKLKLANEAADHMEAKDIREEAIKVRNKDNKQVKLGDSLHSKEDWAWNQGDEDWDGVQDKGVRKEEKRKRDRLRKKERVEKAEFVANCSIGTHQITID